MNRHKYNYSVIIPHFTRDGDVSALIRAVSSVPEREDVQVVVVDNSLKPIDAKLFTSRKNVQILFSPNERKAGGARNVGIENSDAKWLLFLDADDLFKEKAFDVFDSHLDSKNDIEFSVMTGAYSDDLKKWSDRGEVYANLVRDFLSSGDDTKLRLEYRSPCAKMVSSDLVNKNNIRFDEVPASNDVMFGLRIGLAAKSIGADERETYVATVSQGSLTKTLSLENIESRFNVCLDRNQTLVKNGYKKDSSVMLFIVKSLHYGVKPFLRLLWKAIKSGDLFVGWRNWLGTLLHLFDRKKRNEKKKYQITE
jgi:glycosyltransferase involved in cell wall biosynthesis